jgi:hypothetical protein
MATHGQHPQESPLPKRSGGGQSVVELCATMNGGLVFWSRQRFEIGAELQIRILRSALPAGTVAGKSKWVTVRGFVIECPAVRRHDGATGFKVSLLLDSALMQTPTVSLPRGRLRCVSAPFAGFVPQGFN